MYTTDEIFRVETDSKLKQEYIITVKRWKGITQHLYLQDTYSGIAINMSPDLAFMIAEIIIKTLEDEVRGHSK